MNRDGVAKEVKACFELAKLGKHILRLPENVFDKIDILQIADRPYRLLLKFKNNFKRPRGYPDVYFDGKTWDFKTSTFQNEDSLRQTIKEGRKADNIIFIINKASDYTMLGKAIKSEMGRRKKDGSWNELPNIYSWFQGNLDEIWIKQKRQGSCL